MSDGNSMLRNWVPYWGEGLAGFQESRGVRSPCCLCFRLWMTTEWLPKLRCPAQTPAWQNNQPALPWRWRAGAGNWQRAHFGSKSQKQPGIWTDRAPGHRSWNHRGLCHDVQRALVFKFSSAMWLWTCDQPLWACITPCKTERRINIFRGVKNEDATMMILISF